VTRERSSDGQGPEYTDTDGALKRQGSRAIRRCVGLSIGALLMSSCCHQVVIGSHPQIGSIFDGFVFVGQWSSGTTPGSHGTCGSALPGRLTAAYQYIFHHQRPFDSEQFAASLLPRRLAESGFRVSKPFDAPPGPVDISSAGPLWSVRLGRNGCHGTIEHILDPGLLSHWPPSNRNWEPADYVLVLTGTCE
jgi:hypothetical protein